MNSVRAVAARVVGVVLVFAMPASAQAQGSEAVESFRNTATLGVHPFFGIARGALGGPSGASLVLGYDREVFQRLAVGASVGFGVAGDSDGFPSTFEARVGWNAPLWSAPTQLPGLGDTWLSVGPLVVATAFFDQRYEATGAAGAGATVQVFWLRLCSTVQPVILGGRSQVVLATSASVRIEF